MNAIVTSKSRNANLLEGIALSGTLQFAPSFAGSVLLLKLVGLNQIVGHPGGALIFVVFCSALLAVTTALLWPRYPRVIRSYQPPFFDATLSWKEKIVRWRSLPTTSVELLTHVIWLSVLAVAVASFR